jgi:hypothetical protein
LERLIEIAEASGSGQDTLAQSRMDIRAYCFTYSTLCCRA